MVLVIVRYERNTSEWGWAIFSGIMLLLVGALFLSIAVDKGVFARQESSVIQKEDETTTKVDIKNLTKGPSHQETWIHSAEKDLLNLKQQQKLSADKQDELSKYLAKESISKKELADILKKFKKEILEESKSSQSNSAGTTQTNDFQGQGSPIEVIENTPKKIIKKIGEYIPAGSYVPAKMISGIDAGIGIAAEANPRQVLLRVVGKVISAGYGKHYLTSKKLVGCTVQCQAIGDLSSEKAYLKPVLMTCAKSKDTVIEVPIKGYVTSSGKVGIRGEIIERSGDLVTKSFLAGLIGGLGNSASQSLEPGFALSGGFAVKNSGTKNLKNIFGAGVGKGVSTSSNRLSDYLIKRAEQYQPIISINEGVSVNVVFQEGFSLKEEKDV